MAYKVEILLAHSSECPGPAERAIRGKLEDEEVPITRAETARHSTSQKAPIPCGIQGATVILGCSPECLGPDERAIRGELEDKDVPIACAEAICPCPYSIASVLCFEASKSYLRAYQNVEAILSGLTAAWLAWRIDSPVFTRALKLVGPLVPLHPGFRTDPLLGVFLSKIEPFLLETLKPPQDEGGIRAYLVDELRVFVDGREVRLPDWHNHKAIKAFIYLLLSPKHRIPVDHLFYLLWPRNAYNRKNKYGLYTAINSIRRNLGRPDLLIKKHDFYQLEDTWTDLGEIENLVRLADATADPREKEEYLARARELAKGELLPEFPYDKHIEEYRKYYERMRRRLGLG